VRPPSPETWVGHAADFLVALFIAGSELMPCHSVQEANGRQAGFWEAWPHRPFLAFLFILPMFHSNISFCHQPATMMTISRKTNAILFTLSAVVTAVGAVNYIVTVGRVNTMIRGWEEGGPELVD